MAFLQDIQELEALGAMAGYSAHGMLPLPSPIDISRAGKLLNQIRHRHGAGPVAPDKCLERLARVHALTMAERGRVANCFGPGTSLRSRLAAAGLHGVGAESVGAGHSTVDSLFQDWEQSRGHLRIMTSTGMARYGFAAATNPRSRYRTYWTLILLRPSTRNAVPFPPIDQNRF